MQFLGISKGNDLHKHRHWKIVGCSAVTGDGLAASMDWIVEDISSRVFLLS
jgi:ADP-ribosylation factor-like protein 2